MSAAMAAPSIGVLGPRQEMRAPTEAALGMKPEYLGKELFVTPRAQRPGTAVQTPSSSSYTDDDTGQMLPGFMTPATPDQKWGTNYGHHSTGLSTPRISMNPIISPYATPAHPLTHTCTPLSLSTAPYPPPPPPPRPRRRPRTRVSCRHRPSDRARGARTIRRGAREGEGEGEGTRAASERPPLGFLACSCSPPPLPDRCCGRYPPAPYSPGFLAFKSAALATPSPLHLSQNPVSYPGLDLSPENPPLFEWTRSPPSASSTTSMSSVSSASSVSSMSAMSAQLLETPIPQPPLQSMSMTTRLTPSHLQTPSRSAGRTSASTLPPQTISTPHLMQLLSGGLSTGYNGRLTSMSPVDRPVL